MPPFASQVTAAGPPSSAMEGSTKPTRDGSPAIGRPQLGGKKYTPEVQPEPLKTLQATYDHHDY